MKGALQIVIWGTCLVVVIGAIVNGRRTSREMRELEFAGPRMLSSVVRAIEGNALHAERLRVGSGTLWMPEGLPLSWARQSNETHGGNWVSIDPVKEGSREQPIEIIKVTQATPSEEGHRRFFAQRWRYWWRDGKEWMKDSESDALWFATVEIDGNWQAVYLPPTAIE